jgi:hypothetical protein
MAFTQQTFSPVSSNSTNAPAQYSYKTDDTLAQVRAADYFKDKEFQLDEGDFIFIYAADGVSVANVMVGGSISLSLSTGPSVGISYYKPILAGNDLCSPTNTTSFFPIVVGAAGRTIAYANGFEETALNSGVLRYIGEEDVDVEMVAHLMTIFNNANPNRAAYFDFFINGAQATGDRGGVDVNNGVSVEAGTAINTATLSNGDEIELKARNASDLVTITFYQVDITIKKV